MASSSSSGRGATLVHVAFKQDDSTHFVAATATGFHVFSCDPLERVLSRRRVTVPSDGDGAKVTAAELLTRSEVAVVTTRKPINAVDDGAVHEEYEISSWTQLCGRTMTNGVKSPGGAIGGVRLLGEYMLVAGEDKAVLYVRGHRKEEVETGPNPLGLCALARPEADDGGQATTTLVYALPRPEQGAVQVRRRGTAGSVDVRAHRSSDVACLALSRDGRLLATAGSKGTLVRVFSATDGKMLQQLRRGTDGATIHCIVFSPDSKWLAVSSDKGTVHVFSVDVDLTSSAPEEGDGTDAPMAAPVPSPAPAKASQGSSSSPLSFIKGYLPMASYFGSVRSLAQCRVREGTKYSVAFGQAPNTIVIIGMDGSFYRCLFDPVKGGEMILMQYKNFMDTR